MDNQTLRMTQRFSSSFRILRASSKVAREHTPRAWHASGMAIQRCKSARRPKTATRQLATRNAHCNHVVARDHDRFPLHFLSIMGAYMAPP